MNDQIKIKLTRILENLVEADGGLMKSSNPAMAAAKREVTELIALNQEQQILNNNPPLDHIFAYHAYFGILHSMCNELGFSLVEFAHKYGGNMKRLRAIECLRGMKERENQITKVKT